MNIPTTRLTRPSLRFGDAPPRSSSSATLRLLRRGARERSGLATAPPCPHQNALNQVNPGLKKTDQTLCHFEKRRKTRQRRGRGMGAAHRSPSQPPEGRNAARGGEDRGGGCTRSLEAGKGPGSPRTGSRKAQIPPTPPPVLLEPESRFPSC